MKQAIYKENVLLNAMLRDILVANPQSAKKADILSALDDRYDPMPDYMMAEIMEGIEIIGAKEQLERNIALHLALKGNSFANIVKYYKNDTIDVNSLDSLQAYLENDHSMNSCYQLALSKLYTGDTLGALEALDNIPVDFTLDEAQTYSHSRFQDLFDILIEIPSDSTGIDSTILAEMVDLANENDELAGIYTRNMLISAGQLSYIEPVYLPANLKKNPTWNKSNAKICDKDSYIKVFPNPCSSFFIIEYDLRNFSVPAHIEITDLTGREIIKFPLKDKLNQRIVDTRAFSEGTYFITLFIDDKLNVTRKVNIVK